MLDGGVFVEVLEVGLLVGDDDVDVVDGAKAVVGHGEEAVGVGREVDAGDVGGLIGDDVEEAGILVGEAVVILTPDERGDEEHEGADGGAPGGFFLGGLEPLGVLVVHGIDDVDEGLVGGEEAVTAGEDVALEPAFEGVLGEHLHDAAVGGHVGAVGVLGEVAVDPGLAMRTGVDAVEFVGGGLVGAEDAEVCHVAAHGVAEEGGEDFGGEGFGGAGFFDGNGVVAEVGEFEGLAEEAAVGVGVGADATEAGGREGLEFGDEGAVLVEEGFGVVGAEPGFELLEMHGVVDDLCERDLVGAPEPFDFVAVDFFGAGPALWGAEDDDGPARTVGAIVGAGFGLDAVDLVDAVFEGGGHALVAVDGVVGGEALDGVGGVAVAAEEVV